MTRHNNTNFIIIRLFNTLDQYISPVNISMAHNDSLNCKYRIESTETSIWINAREYYTNFIFATKMDISRD